MDKHEIDKQELVNRINRLKEISKAFKPSVFEVFALIEGRIEIDGYSKSSDSRKLLDHAEKCSHYVDLVVDKLLQQLGELTISEDIEEEEE